MPKKEKKKVFYSNDLYNKISANIPLEVRQSLAKHGWNELGIYEKVVEAMKECKKEGIPIVVETRTDKIRDTKINEILK